MDPESAHHFALKVAGAMQNALCLPLVEKSFSLSQSGLQTQVFGLQFSNPIGLAAGFDKDCLCPYFLAALGFSHSELEL